MLWQLKIELCILGGKKWKWGGCSDNIKFGADISRDYLDSKEFAKDARASFVRHNKEAGRMVSVEQNSQTQWGLYRSL